MQAFHSLLRSLYEGFDESPFRAKAWERFLQLGLPGQVRNLYTGSYTPPEPQAVAQEKINPTQEFYVVLVNGQFVPKLSHLPQGVVATPLREAMHTYSAFLKERFLQGVKQEKDPFAAINGALHQPGGFLYVPQGVSAKLEVIHVLTAPEMMATPRLHFFVKGELDLSFTLSAQEGCWVNQYCDFALEEGAKVTTEMHTSSHVFDAVRATLKRDANFTSRTFTSGGLRSNHHIQLNGENAEASLSCAAKLEGKRELHSGVLMEHVAPNCRSSQLFKTVLDDQSRATFDGKIYVHQEAQKTEAFQLNKNLLLSDTATARSLPNLEIFADDVKASHGSTTGQFDPDELFYLRSRGLTEQEAKKLLITAFLAI